MLSFQIRYITLNEQIIAYFSEKLGFCTRKKKYDLCTMQTTATQLHFTMSLNIVK